MDKFFGGQNEKEAYAPASITKILTAIMAIESNKLEEVVTISEQPPPSGRNTCLFGGGGGTGHSFGFS